jgi:hypothetical protein
MGLRASDVSLKAQLASALGEHLYRDRAFRDTASLRTPDAHV